MSKSFTEIEGTPLNLSLTGSQLGQNKNLTKQPSYNIKKPPYYSSRPASSRSNSNFVCLLSI